MLSKSVFVVLALMAILHPAAAEPFQATVGGKPVTAVVRTSTKDLGLGLNLGRDELLEAARTSRPLKLAPSDFGSKDLGGSASPGK